MVVAMFDAIKAYVYDLMSLYICVCIYMLVYSTLILLTSDLLYSSIRCFLNSSFTKSLTYVLSFSLLRLLGVEVK